MSDRPHDETLVVLTLELQGEMFAIAAAQVHEILDPVPVTEVPGAAVAPLPRTHPPTHQPMVLLAPLTCLR